ncbi:acyl-protein thioesteras-like protein 1 [Viridothelium virens]|uniref:Acyl-protein thioesterase 1 n=1 Tax=Viridothelium virens TaxID=1048519 RepID=A0A6A6H2E6_VIRVR|nr:acyl-protein thioesteras-like protein 1 [Viridothelium virens]
MSGPAALVVPALKRHTATVIVSHGLGDSGAGWIWLAENWRRRGKFEEVSFVFPNAPTIPITMNMGMKMPGWYDIISFDDLQQREDESGILRSRDTMHNIISAEVAKGIPSNRIILGGFSQGGAVSLLGGVTCPQKLAGIFGLSSYLLLRGKIRDMVPTENPNKETPIFLGHGDADLVVKYEWGQNTAQTLKEWGWNVDFRTYPNLPHSADPQEIDHLEAFINERVPPLGEKAQEAL